MVTPKSSIYGSSILNHPFWGSHVWKPPNVPWITVQSKRRGFDVAAVPCESHLSEPLPLPLPVEKATFPRKIGYIMLYTYIYIVMFSVNREVQGLIILTLIYTQSLVQSRDTSFMSLSRLWWTQIRQQRMRRHKTSLQSSLWVIESLIHIPIPLFKHETSYLTLKNNNLIYLYCKSWFCLQAILNYGDVAYIPAPGSSHQYSLSVSGCLGDPLVVRFMACWKIVHLVRSRFPVGFGLGGTPIHGHFLLENNWLNIKVGGTRCSDKSRFFGTTHSLERLDSKSYPLMNSS